jgi:hypothetical protein
MFPHPVHQSAKTRKLVFAVLTMFCIGTSIAVAQTPQGAIPNTLFGMHLINYSNWPSVPFALLGKGTGVGWPNIEQKKGQYNWSRLDAYVSEASVHRRSFMWAAGGVPPWAAANTSTCHYSVYGTGCTSTVTNMQDWDNFVTALVSRYRGQIKVYELWNEPQQSFTGTYGQLVTLTQHEHDIIRSIDPQAAILSPSVVSYGSPYLDAYFAAGGTRAIDGVAIHSYPNPSNAIPETLTGSLTTSVRAVMSKYGLSAKQMWDTEGSWGLGAITDPNVQAAFVARAHLLHWSIGVARFYWYAWDSPWGTLWTSSGPSLAATAYAQVYRWMVGATMPTTCSHSGTNGYHAVYTCTLTRSNGYQARAVWNTDGNSTYTVPTQFTYYGDLNGNKFSVPSNHQVTIGIKPILLSNM